MPTRSNLVVGCGATLLLIMFAAACSGGGSSTPAGAQGPTLAAGTSAAGGGGTAPASGSAGVDPCALVTASEAQAAIGVPVAAAQPNDNGIDTVCEYKSADGRNSLAVLVRDGGTDQASFDLGMKGSDQWAPVAGVGTDADFNADTDTLTFWQSNNMISIQITDESGNSTPAQIQAAATKVANIALGRL